MSVGSLRTLNLPGGARLQVLVDAALSGVNAGQLPADAQVVIALDMLGADSTRPAFGAGVREALGDQLWAIFTDADDSTQLCHDLLLAAYVASGLLDRGCPVVVCTTPARVELLAAAVLLVRGFSQPMAIEVVRTVLPDAFPEIDDEVALAAIDHVRLEREALGANASRNSL